MVINKVKKWLRKPSKPITYKELLIYGSIYLTGMILLRVYVFQLYYEWYEESKLIEALDKIIEENVIHAEVYITLDPSLMQKLNITETTIFGGIYNGSS